MSKEKESGSPQDQGGVIRLKFSSLLALCIGLVLATGAVMSLVGILVPRAKPGLPADFGMSRAIPPEPATVPAWGEFVTYDIELEQPEEYVAFEATANRTAHWIFPEL